MPLTGIEIIILIICVILILYKNYRGKNKGRWYMATLINRFVPKNILRIEDKVMRSTRFFAKILIPIILVGAIVWMSYSRINNINSTFETYRAEGFKGFWLDITIVTSILLIIYFVFLYFVNKTIDAYNNIKSQLNDFINVFNKLQDENGEIKINAFKENYDNILKEIRSIKGNNGYIGKIWWEFCETLIIKRENETDNPNAYCENNHIEKLRNTDQIETYFNSDVIINKQVQREVLDVIPGILTGLGLVGTFLAIAIALIGFDMSHIELSIQNLLGGLSIKFISSLVGITTSIMFLFLKSHLFSKLETSISCIQLQLNSIFPRRTSESYLCHIWEQIELSNERLEDLEDYAEEQKKLSDRFIDEMGSKIEEVLKGNAQNDIKEVLDDLSKNLSNSITGNLRETMEKLIAVMEDVKATKEQSSNKALTDVLENIFNNDSIKDAGSNIAKSLNNEITTTVSSMSEQNQKVEDLVQAVGSYVNQLHDYESKVEDHYKDLLGNIDKALNTQTDFVGKNQDYVAALEQVSSQINSTAYNLNLVADKLTSAFEEFTQAASSVSGIVETSNTIVDNTRELNNNLEQVFEKFKDGTQSSTEKLFNQFGESISEICGKIQASVGELEDITSNFEGLQDSIETLNEILQDKQRN